MFLSGRNELHYSMRWRPFGQAFGPYDQGRKRIVLRPCWAGALSATARGASVLCCGMTKGEVDWVAFSDVKNAPLMSKIGRKRSCRIVPSLM
jgi:hypothetical protein